MELRDTLDRLRRDVQHRLDKIMKEYTITEQDLTSSMVRIERANLHSLIQDQLKRSFPAPAHTSPKPSPLIPHTRGPVEMLILMDGHPRQVKCFRCRKWGHKAQECPRKKGRTCTICGNRKHKKAGCPYQRPPKVEVEVDVEVRKEIKELGKMTLLDRIACTGPHQFAPSVANGNQVMVRWNARSTRSVDGVDNLGHMGLLGGTGAKLWTTETPW